MNELYNSEIKHRYINKRESEIILADGFLLNLFKKTKSFEEDINKDVSCFTYYEIEDMYKTWNYTSFHSLQVHHSILSVYTDWCINNSLVPDSQNHFREFNMDKLMNCLNLVVINNRVFSREQVLQWCKEVSLKNPSDAFILLALFEGIRGEAYKDIADLRLSDFNKNELTVYLPHSKKTVKVSQTLYDYAKKSDEILVYNSLLSSAEIPLLDDGLIIKNKYNSKAGADIKNRNRRVEKRVGSISEYLELSNLITPKSLLESGVVYYINEKCKETGSTAYEYIKRNGAEIENQFDYKIIRTNKRFCERFKEYLA